MNVPGPGGGPSRGRHRLRVRSALLRLDGTFEPPYLVVDGDIDITTLAAFSAALSRLLAHGSGDVWVDAERLRFIDVGGLRAIAATACRLGLQDRRLVLRSVAPHLIRLMDLVGWSQISNLSMLAREPRPAATAPATTDGRGRKYLSVSDSPSLPAS
ncbi:STAS domain-containing protein [Spirillospora sp. NPDC029432]|uniref:STAS domain-containing protein n=1 Tax=Spirillospora sp. NPDC029432 TaxID=3154599 RepID=UPI003454DBC5